MFGTYCRLNVHVWASNREVIRAARKMLNPPWQKQPRYYRHKFYRLMLEYHKQQQDLVARFRL
jgi:hypothetical protein